MISKICFVSLCFVSVHMHAFQSYIEDANFGDCRGYIKHTSKDSHIEVYPKTNGAGKVVPGEYEGAVVHSEKKNDLALISSERAAELYREFKIECNAQDVQALKNAGIIWGAMILIGGLAYLSAKFDSGFGGLW